MRLDPESWSRVKALFEEALALDPGARSAFLEERTRGRPDLRREVESLLRGLEEAPEILERPARELFPDMGAEPAAGGPGPGLRVGSWVLEAEIARGGMGSVWKGVDPEDPSRPVAIKFLRRELDSVPMLRRFARERRALNRLHHPNIARLLDAGALPTGQPWLAMELVHGVPIDRFCADRRLGLRDRLRLFQEVCRTVDYAHRHLLVHRDLKPANILVTPEGRPVLLDFGVAKLLDEDETTGPGLTAQHALPLTPDFAAPEQIQGGLVSPAADVYALGVLLFRLVTGMRPYAAGTLPPLEIERIVCEKPVPRPSSVLPARGEAPSPGLPRSEALRRRLRGDLDRIVLYALNKEPERRYPSAEALAADLDRYLRGEPVLARSPSAGYLLLKAARKQPWAAAGLLLAFLGLVSTLGVFLWQRGKVEASLYYAQERAQLNEIIRRALGVDFDGSLAWLERSRLGVQRSLELLEAYLNTPEVRQDEWVHAGYKHFLGMAWLPHDLDRAEELLLSAAADRARLHPPDHPERAESEHGLGVVAWRKGQYRKAVTRFRRSLEIREEAFGPVSQPVAESLKFLGMTLAEMDEFGAARKCQERALAIHRELYGSTDPHASNHLAEIAAAEGDLDAAIEAVSRAVAAEEAMYRPTGHPDLATSLHNQGVLRARAGRFAEAALSFARSLELREHFFPGDAVLLGRTRFYLARAWWYAGERESALRTLRETAGTLAAAGGEEEQALLRQVLAFWEEAAGIAGRDLAADPVWLEVRRVLPEG